MPIEPENILKGKMAETLVKELLLKCGNRVYHFSNREILENLSQFEKLLERETDIGKKVSSIPDFIVISPKEKIFFIEVKFRTAPEALEEELLLEKEFLEKFWEAKIILVTPKEKPYFRVLTPPYFTKETKEGWPIPILNWKSIEDSPELEINLEILKEFNKLVKKYYPK